MKKTEANDTSNIKHLHHGFPLVDFKQCTQFQQLYVSINSILSPYMIKLTRQSSTEKQRNTKKSSRETKGTWLSIMVEFLNELSLAQTKTPTTFMPPNSILDTYRHKSGVKRHPNYQAPTQTDEEYPVRKSKLRIFR